MNLSTCRYCGSPIAWVPSSIRGHVPLDLEPVALATAHPEAPLYVTRRDGTAQPARDVHRPPALVYVKHRCPQYGDSRVLLEACRPAGDDLVAWLDAMPPAQSSRRRLRVVS